MKLLRFVMFLFYRYYSKGGTYRIPYFSALCAVVFLIYMHFFQLLIVTNAVDLLPMNKELSRAANYLKLAGFLLPVFLLVHFLVKEKALKALHYDSSTIKTGGIILTIYIVLSFILLIGLMFLVPKR